MAKNAPHPAISAVLQPSDSVPYSDRDRGPVGLEHATSVSLARALAVGGLSRLDPSLMTVDVWDPAAGLGFAGYLLVDALQSSGVEVRYRGQDINEAAVSASLRRFEAVHDAEIAHADTLAHDAFEDFSADLVIVDAPWGMDWRRSAAAVEARRSNGERVFGLPPRSDSTRRFIS
ncbi:N-6 DNA methylase, partial [Micrococcus sp. SIMBA_144]